VDDGLTFCIEYRVRLKAGFLFEAIPAYAIHGKKGSFLKPRGDVEDDLKWAKTNLDS
jgi:hypothetical protein